MVASITRSRGTEDGLHLPTRADTALRVVALLDDADVSVRDVASVIASDPGLAARLLRVANSPYFGLGRNVGEVQQAVVLLGFSVVRALVLSAVAGVLATGSSTEPTPYYWEHSALVAAASAIVARHVQLVPGEAFAAGLLHDVGSVVKVEDDAQSTSFAEMGVAGQTARAEAPMFGTSHAQLGAKLLDEWRLPAGLVEAVLYHHEQPSFASSPLAAVVVVGEAVAVACARLETPDSFPAAGSDSAGDDAAGVSESAVIDEFIVPTLVSVGLDRLDPTLLLLGVRAEADRVQALVALVG